ncbi:Lsr2 dimerization domain-containing protein [Amycolatopsis sp. NPDC003731]
MARERIVQYNVTDDFTGEKIEETEAEYIRFEVGGFEYSFEVGAATRTKFKTALKAFITAGDKDFDEDKGYGPFKRAKGKPVAGAPAANSERAEWQQRVRSWGQSVGHDVKDKGRIASKVIDAYVAAHPDDPDPGA